MWTAQRGRGSQRDYPPIAQVGGVTLAELPLGVYVDGERRNLPLYTAGGYQWMPRVGDSVLVLKTTDGGCVVGRALTETALEEGEVKLSGEGCEIHLTAQGQVAVSGELTVNGESLETLILRLMEERDSSE